MAMDQASKKTSQNYVYGYDLYSNSVRKYTPVNDMKTVKLAVINNINDYLDYLEICEPDSKHDKYKNLSYVPVIFSVIAAVILAIGGEVIKPHTWVTYLLVTICIASSMIGYFFDYMQNAESIAFTCIISPLPDGDGYKKECFRALKGRRLCVRVDDVPSTSKLGIEVQVVGPPRFCTPPRVYFSFRKEVPYGRYFSKDGFFYPPPLLDDIDILLGTLKTTVTRKKQ